jgi:succinylglutamate desuccinylase
MHGNEPAGINALEIMFKMLEVEPVANPNFNFCGRMIGLRGNLKAINAGKRFIEKDLNRQWTDENVARIKHANTDEELGPEDLEIKQILNFVKKEIEDYQPERIIVLDLHTTTAFGGIFTVAAEDVESVEIGIELHAPVITGLLRGIKGSCLHYFCTKNFGIHTTPVVFESGQHNEELSINRAIAAITNCMRTIGCVRAEDVENRHDELLVEYSKGLPKVADLVTIHSVNPGDGFKMKPGYKNFQSVKKGEVLATDKHGDIKAVEDSRILMPLYQEQGEDGFFLIRDVQM